MCNLTPVTEQPKSSVPDRWEDIGRISGHFINSSSKLFLEGGAITNPINKNVFTTTEEAEASLAWAQLTQLRNATNGVQATHDEGFAIVMNSDGPYIYEYSIGDTDYIPTLYFRTEAIANEFLTKHRDLIMKAARLTL